jgi:hypothetical protein
VASVKSKLKRKTLNSMEQLLGDDYDDWVKYQEGNPPDPIPMQSAPNEHLIDTVRYKKMQFQDWCLGTGQRQETIIAGIGLLSRPPA